MGRYGDGGPAGEIPARQRFIFSLDLFRLAVGNDVTAVCARSRPEIDQMIGGGDHFPIVFDHQQRIAQVAQPFERGDQSVVVARVQPDRRLVEDVKHAGQAAADLRGESDALRLAAGKRRRGTHKREVAEPDVEQEAQPRADLVQ